MGKQELRGREGEGEVSGIRPGGESGAERDDDVAARVAQLEAELAEMVAVTERVWGWGSVWVGDGTALIVPPFQTGSRYLCLG